MIRVEKDNLNSLLASKGLSLAQFAKRCGISRQSIYEMFRGGSIFSRPFEKMMRELNVDFTVLLTSTPRLDDIMGDAPDAIKRAAIELQRYAEEHKADLYLIGSRTRGREGFRADWDFGIFFKQKRPADFSRTKQHIKDTAFPHRMDIVDLSSAPSWFLRSVADDALHMVGETNHDIIFRRSA